MQDIADAVGVSKATVSYVLNGKENSRVSEETRDRILHIANLYNYTPNFAAKYLSSKVSNFIGIIFGDMDIATRWADNFALMDLLAEVAEAAGDKLIYINMSGQEWKKKLSYPYDVLIAADVSASDIARISKATFSPLILVDSLTEDSLFFQVVTGYEPVQERGTLICSSCKNELYQKYIREQFHGWDIHECQTAGELKAILSTVNSGKLTVLGKNLGELAQTFAQEGQEICILEEALSAKIQTIQDKITVLRCSENLDDVCEHVTKVPCKRI